MPPLSRRQFLKNSAIAGAAASISGCSGLGGKPAVEPQPANQHSHSR